MPYRPKRRTKAQIAREAGLEPLAEALLTRPDQNPEQLARGYVAPNKGVTDATAAPEGARAILVERFSEDASLIGTPREEVWLRGRLRSRVRAGKAETGAKFADYFEFSETLVKLPSHRILALFRGEKEEVLALELVPDPTVLDRGEPGIFERQIANQFKITDQGRPGDRWLLDTVRLAWRTRILVHIESDMRLRLWQAAEDAGVQVLQEGTGVPSVSLRHPVRLSLESIFVGGEPPFRSGVNRPPLDPSYRRLRRRRLAGLRQGVVRWTPFVSQPEPVLKV